MNMTIVKKISALAAALMCMSTAVVSAYASTVLDKPVLVEETERQVCDVVEYATGDVNGDGKVNVTDITLAVAHLKGIKLLDNISTADMNGDGIFNIDDISILSAKVKGKR
jgi:hypothetical protein